MASEARHASAEARGALRWLPGLATLRHYDPAWLRNDLVAGLVMTAMLVPVGIAYAVASGLPGIHGLYATIVPLLVYAVFGPSRIFVLGPDSALASLILAVVLPLAAGDPARAVALAGAMALVSGLICIGAGLLRLGFLTELLSKPIRYGYMNGIAITVLISQLPKLFGFSVPGDDPLQSLWAFVRGVADGRTNAVAFAVGGAALLAILLLKRYPRLPGMLLAVAAATIAVGTLGLEAHGVGVLSSLPEGLPAFALPWIGVDDLVPVLAGGAAVALVSFADTSVLSRSYAARTGTRVDPNQEMVALGAANLATGLFQGFPIRSSASRTPVAEAAGARTQLTGVGGALAVAALLLFAPGLLRHLPYAALAAVVIASALGLFEIADLRRIYRIQRWEAWLSIVCAAFIGLVNGLFVTRLKIPSFLVTLGMLLVVRGIPQFLIYRKAIPAPRQRGRFALLVATALPIIVAVTSIEVDAGIMDPRNAAALVGAGALSVLVFPLVGTWLVRNEVPDEESIPDDQDRAANTA